MANRYSGQLRISVEYDDRGGDYRVGVTDGKHRWRGRVRPAPAGFGPGVGYDSPRAYDEIARSALAFASDEMGDLDEMAAITESGYHVGRTPATAWGSGSRDRSRRKPGKRRKAASKRGRTGARRDAGAAARYLQARKKIDRLLSEAQDIIARELSNLETKLSAPRAWKVGDDAYEHVERARRAIAGMR